MNLEGHNISKVSTHRPASWKPPLPLPSHKVPLLCAPQFLVLTFTIAPGTGCSFLLAGPAFNDGLPQLPKGQ